MLVEGGAGTGRSRLLAEAARLARDRRIDAACAAADELAASAPLGTLVEALRAGERPALGASDLEDLAAVASVPRDVFEHLGTLLRARARSLLVALDDVQWADAATLHALAALAGRVPHVLWLVSLRPLPAAPGVDAALDGLRAAGAASLHLPALDDRAVAQLAGDIAGAAPDAALTGLLEGAAGCPGYVVELLRGLLDEGRITVAGGRATARGDLLPVRLGSTVEAHLRPLSAAARQLLAAGSVLGPEFTSHRAAAMLGQSRAEMLLAAAEAVAARVVRDVGARLVFCQELVRRVVYERLTGSERLALHRDAGRLLLACGGGPAGAARHYAVGATPGDREATDVLHDAAWRVAVTSPGAGADLGLVALGLLSRDDDRRPGLLAFVVPLLGALGRLHEVEDLAKAALDEGLHADAEATVRLGIATGLIHSGRSHAAADQLRRGLEHGNAAGVPRADVLVARATLLAGTDPGAATALASAAIREGEANSIQAPVVGGLIVQATVALHRGRPGRALTIAGEAVERAEAGGVWARLRHPRRLLAMAHLGLGRFDDALSVTAGGCAEAATLGSAWFAGLCQGLAALAHLGAGRLAEAADAATSALAIAEDGRLGVVEAHALGVLAQVLVRQGDQAGARAHVERVQPLADEGWELTAGPGWPLAALAGAESRPAAALAALDGALAQLRQGSFAFCVLDPSRLPVVVRLALQTGDRTRAALAAAAARRLAARNRAQPSLAGHAAHARGLLHGDVELLRRAVELLRPGPRPLALGEALEDVGQALVTEGRRADASNALEEAHGAFAAHGAAHDAARVRGVLRSLGVRRRRAAPRDPGARAIVGWGSLTESERLTARLVAEGLTNRAIAERLYISPNTVGTHLRHVFSKLRVRSRVDLARLVIARGGDGTPP